jgi:hypothetical protein
MNRKDAKAAKVLAKEHHRDACAFRPLFSSVRCNFSAIGFLPWRLGG